MPFVSCNSDDDTHELVIDAIVGEWYQIEKRQLIDGIEKTIPMTSCEKLNSFNIKKNGTTTCSFYFRNDYDECELDGYKDISWVATTDLSYSFTYEDEDDLISTVKLEGEILTEIYSFTSDGNRVQVINVYSTTPDESGDDEGVVQNLIIGKWRESRFIEKHYEDGVLQKTVNSEPTDTDYFELEFKSDDTFIEFGSVSFNDENGEPVVETHTNVGTYETKENLLIVTIPPDEKGENGTVDEVKYSISGDVIKFYSFEEYTENGIAYKNEYTKEYHRL